MSTRVTVIARNAGGRQLALRAAEHLIEHPEKRDTIIVFDDGKEFWAYRTKAGSIVSYDCFKFGLL